MTINERTTLLPKEYQKTYSIAIPQDDLNNNVSNITDDNGVLCEYDSYALTKDELNKYIDDPWWIKMRYCCFATCWIVCLVALAISLYIAADALQHDVCLTPLTNNGTSLGPADLSISTNAIPLVADGAVSTPPSSIVFTLLNQPTS